MLGQSVDVSEVSPSKVDKFGCRSDWLDKDLAYFAANVSVFRKATCETAIKQIATPGRDRGFVVGVAMLPGHSRRIFHEHSSTTHFFKRDSIYIRNLADPYKADLIGPFDFILLEFTVEALARIAEDADLGRVTSLATRVGSSDRILANLVRALAPAIKKPAQATNLFMDQLTTAIGAHIAQRYGGTRSTLSMRPKGLSRSHERLAKELLLENLDGNIAIMDVARACNLSRGYFIQSFRENTGMTPYQWLLKERVARARMLLLTSDEPLSHVAISCGFADQSHFTRVFTSAVGITPGAVRRNL